MLCQRLRIAVRASQIIGHTVPRLFVVSYVLAIIAWNLLFRSPASSWWPLQLVGVFNVWLYLPLVPLVFVVLITRDWRWGGWLVVPVAFFAAQYGQLLVPSTHAADGVPLRVMSANVEFQNRDAAGVADRIKELSPDVIGLQELGTGISAPLADMLRSEYPYQALYPSRSSRGMGVLSRYPIVESRPPEMANTECNCQQVTLDVHGQDVTVLNVHPNPPRVNIRRAGPFFVPVGFSTSVQESIMLAVTQRASSLKTPVLIMGDMNMTDTEKPYSIVAQSYHDSYREAGQGLGFTFPSRRIDVPFGIPVMRIDYVFHDDSWSAHVAQVEDMPGSDHNGLYTELFLRSRFAAQGR